MGTTLAAWRIKRADEVKPYHYQGVATSARCREYKALQHRMAEWRMECEARYERERLAKRAKMLAPPPSVATGNAAHLGLQIIDGGRI